MGEGASEALPVSNLQKRNREGGRMNPRIPELAEAIGRCFEKIKSLELRIDFLERVVKLTMPQAIEIQRGIDDSKRNSPKSSPSENENADVVPGPEAATVPLRFDDV